VQQFVLAREADGDVSNANLDAEFAVSIIQALRRVAALISQAQTRFPDVTQTGGVGFTKWCGIYMLLRPQMARNVTYRKEIGTDQQTARKVLPKHVSLVYIICLLPPPSPPPKKNQAGNKPDTFVHSATNIHLCFCVELKTPVLILKVSGTNIVRVTSCLS